MMKRQHITALEHIERAEKRKASAYKEPVVEPKQARAPVRQPQEFVQAPAPTVVQPSPPHVQPLSSSLISMPVCLDPVMPRPIQEPDISAVVENPLAELLLEPCDEIIANAPAMQQGQRVEALHAPMIGSQTGPSSHGEADLAPEIPELNAQPVAVESCQKPPFDLSKMDVVDFFNNIPARAGPAQLLFMHAVLIPAPSPQFPVVILTTDPRTLKQYDGLVVTQQKTAATFKDKGKAVATIEDESDYGQFSLEDKQESEKAKAEAAQQHQAINDFSGRIPDGLGVKVWRLLNVKWLNSCFQGALGDCMYYSPYSNTVHVGANANQAVAFEFNSHQWAKVPTTIVYKYTLHGLPCTPYELERLYKYYANEHILYRDHVVAYILIFELLQFVQWLDDNLHDRTMQVILSDPLYWDLKNPI
ncbi:hypothetical protein C0995_007435 [Termitomyces sp. Mi166|nr:hypothetical protein C0995_007435 [Termitomyces sp. Mi166\